MPTVEEIAATDAAESNLETPAYMGDLVKQMLGEEPNKPDLGSSGTSPKTDPPAGEAPVKTADDIAKEKEAADKVVAEGIEKEKQLDAGFEKLLEQKSKGKFKTQAEFLAHVDKLEKLIDPEGEDEAIKELRIALKNGTKKEDFYKLASQNFDGMSTKDVIVAKMKKSDPSLTDELAELIYKREFKIDDDEVGEEERKVLDYQEKKKANEARAEFKAEQSKLFIPSKQEVNNQEFETKRIEAEQKFKEVIKGQAEQLKEVKMSLGKNEKGEEQSFNFKFDAKAVEDSRLFMEDPMKALNTMLQGGNPEETTKNIGEFMKKLSLINNLDSFTNDLFIYAKSLVTEEIIQNKQNAARLPQSNNAPAKMESDPAKAAAAHMLR